MRSTRQIFVGVAITAIGLIALLGSIFDIDLGRFLCPTVLILAGVWLLVRPRMARPGTAFTTRLLGDVRRRGEWQVAEEDIPLGVGISGWTWPMPTSPPARRASAPPAL